MPPRHLEDDSMLSDDDAASRTPARAPLGDVTNTATPRDDDRSVVIEVHTKPEKPKAQPKAAPKAARRGRPGKKQPEVLPDPQRAATSPAARAAAGSLRRRFEQTLISAEEPVTPRGGRLRDSFVGEIKRRSPAKSLGLGELGPLVLVREDALDALDEMDKIVARALVQEIHLEPLALAPAAQEEALVDPADIPLPATPAPVRAAGLAGTFPTPKSAPAAKLTTKPITKSTTKPALKPANEGIPAAGRRLVARKPTPPTKAAAPRLAARRVSAPPAKPAAAPSFARAAATVRATKTSRMRASILPDAAGPAKPAPFRASTLRAQRPAPKPATLAAKPAPKPARLAPATARAATLTSRPALGTSRPATLNARPAPGAIKAATLASRPALGTSRPATLNARPAPRAAKRVTSASSTGANVGAAARTGAPRPAPARLVAAFEPPAPAAAKARPVVPSGAGLVRARRAAEADKKAKEEAARNARAEAAERGRLASREWAERRRLKGAAAVAKA